MAYASLVSLAQTIETLVRDNDQYYSISHPEKGEIMSIHECIILLQAFLEDFPDKANCLEGQMRDLANQAEDIIEGFMLEQIRRCMFPEDQRRMFLWLRRMERGIMFMKLKKITTKLNSIKKEVARIKNNTVSTDVVQRSAANPSSSRQLAPTRQDAIVGFDDDLLEIKARLCRESSELQVIPILGMGGIGKTTLAKNVYDDQLCVEHFDIRAWVTVSQDYSTREILSHLLISMKGERSDQSDESQMQENVYKCLKGRRYLIVMDDIWSTNAWDDVKIIFPNDHNGSRVVLTTRHSDVAAYPDCSSPLDHKMQFMDADQSWDLLKQKAFLQENCPSELETIGKEIARSCRGLPLAVVLIAGLLTTVDRTQASWENIARNVNRAVMSTNDEQFGNRILSLSYNNLPHALRPCFLYMGIFPEDYEIHVTRLIRLWVAEGFLKPSGSKSLEQVAEEYLEDLVKRSLVLVITRKANGKIRSCSMHDLLRDLCIRKAQEEKFHLSIMDRYVPWVVRRSIKNQRRIIVAHSDLDFLRKIHGSIIRTIMCFRYDSISLDFTTNFRLLRVLDVLTRTTSISLPAEVFELFLLRYLAFDCPDRIPETISNLKNLQTLIIHYPRRILMLGDELVARLPSEIWRMPQLRHLISFSFGFLPVPKGSTFVLENLQTISKLRDFICNERMLAMIPNVKKLGISYVGEVYGHDYKLENLVHLHQLENLKLERDARFRRKLNPAFPRTLKKLSLCGLEIPWEDMGIVGSLPNLEVLKLINYACVGDRWETTGGEFQSLKLLLIKCSDPQIWITESSHFPSLKCLVLCHCCNLSEIPHDIGEISTLEQIVVSFWTEALLKSAERIQEEQRSYGNDSLQVCLLSE